MRGNLRLKDFGNKKSFKILFPGIISERFLDFAVKSNTRFSNKVCKFLFRVFVVSVLVGFSSAGWGQTSTLYLQNTQTQSGTSTYVLDLTESLGSSGTASSQATNSASFTETLSFTRDISNLTNAISGNSFSVSLNVSNVSSSNLSARFRIQRINSSGTAVASTGYSSEFNSNGVKTANLSFSATQTWVSTDRIRLSIEVRRTNNGSARSITVRTGDTQSFVKYPISCSNAISSFPYVQNFDSWTKSSPAAACTTDGTVALEQCWTNESNDDIDWDIFSGSTASNNTGPTSDHTTGNTGNYLYTESSSGTTGCVNKTGYVTTPTFDFSSLVNPELKFWYNMYGANMGTLSVQISTDGGSTWSANVFSVSGNQGTVWIEATVSLAAYSYQPDVKIRFTGLTGNGYLSDMAIDDVSVTGSACSTPTVSITGSSTICAGSTTTLSPSTGGTWASNNTSVATVTNDGIVTGVSAGSTAFTFTSDAGCSNTTTDVTVTAAPSITTQPSSIALCGSGSGDLTVGVSATSPGYLWQYSSSSSVPWTNVTPEFFVSDFQSLPANANVYGNATVTGGVLQLTQALGSQLGGFVIQSTPGVNSISFGVNFDYQLWNGTGADGISLSFGPDITSDAGGGESGEGSGLILMLDTYDNSAGRTNSQIRINYAGSQVWSNTVGDFDLRNANYRNVSLFVDNSGYLSLTIGGTSIVNNLLLPGYAGADNSAWKFKFSGRTGGLNDGQSIDNLHIQFYDDASLTVSPASATYYRCIVNDGLSNCQVTSATALVTLNPVPSTPSIGNNSPICYGSDAVFTISGTAGNQIIYSGDASGTATIGAGGSTNVTIPGATSGVTINLTNVTDGTCSSSLSGISSSVSILPLPTASISGSTTICSGESSDLSIDVTGTGPWSGTLSNGQSFSGSSSPISVTVNPAATTTYTVASFSDVNCSGNSFSGSATVAIPPDINYTSSGNISVCLDETATLSVSFDEKSVLFNGTSDHITIPNNSDINTYPSSSLLQHRTVALWFKANDVNARQVLYEEGAGVNGFSIFLENGYVTVHAWESNKTWDNAASGQIQKSVVAGKWYNVAFVYDSGASDGIFFKGYLDGVYFGGTDNANGADGMNAHSGDINLGMSDGIRFPDDKTYAGNYFDGHIDEFKLWNRSLPESELQSEQWNVNDGTQSGTDLIVYYNFNNDSGNTVTDLTGGNDGTLSGGVTYETDTPFTPSVLWTPGNMTTYSVGVSPNSTTTYTFQLTNPVNGCTTSGNIKVTVNSPVTPTLIAIGPICSGEDAIFTISGTAGNIVTYSGATSGNAMIGAGGTVDVTIPGATSNVSLNLTNVDDGTCSVPLTAISKTVSVNPLPTASVSGNNSPVCSGEDASFNLSGTSGAIVTYNINGGTNTTTTLTGGVATVVINGATSNQTLNLVSVEDGNCVQNLTASSSISVNPSPTPAISGLSSVCSSEITSYSVTSISGHSYTWTVNGGTITNGAGTSTITVQWGAAGTGTADVTETITATSCSAAGTQKQVTIKQAPLPTFVASAGAQECQNDDVVYTTQSGQSHYVWGIPGTPNVDYSITSGGIGSTNYTVTIKWLTTGNKSVTVNYDNSSGCTGAAPASSTVTIDPIPEIGSFN